MGVRVDKAWRDDTTIGVYDAGCGSTANLADLGDAAVRDRDIGLIPRCSGAVDDGAVPDQQIIRHRRSPSLYARR
jgi:hypothetical protein